jgi:hypothetical protein
VLELARAGTVVGSLTATDPNSGDELSFKLLDDAGGRFALVGRDLVVRQGHKLDYEQSRSHAVGVRVRDKHGLFLDRTIAVTVGDVNGQGSRRRGHGGIPCIGEADSL